MGSLRGVRPKALHDHNQGGACSVWSLPLASASGSSTLPPIRMPIGTLALRPHLVGPFFRGPEAVLRRGFPTMDLIHYNDLYDTQGAPK